jgi:hypothetical protein
VNIFLDVHDNIVQQNLISANAALGVHISGGAYNNRVEGNLIGTDKIGAPVLGNGDAGVRIEFGSSHNVIGGQNTKQGNLIAGNHGPGVGVSTDAGFGYGESISNTITKNRIHSNSGIGIDLSPTTVADGVTPNDPGDSDTGPNNLMNFPVLTSAKATPGQLIVKGTIDTPDLRSVTIEFFANPVPTPGGDPSGYGEGAIFLGTKKPNAQGKFTAALPPVAPGTLITATATDAAGNTSEFAANIVAQ